MEGKTGLAGLEGGGRGGGMRRQDPRKIGGRKGHRRGRGRSRGRGRIGSSKKTKVGNRCKTLMLSVYYCIRMLLKIGM